MRAGKLDRTIQLSEFTSTVDDYGAPVETWLPVGTRRAQKVEASTEEYLRGYGETDATVAIFRIRWMDGLTTKHRVTCEGRNFNIREMKEIGRRRGLELRCEEVRT